jgi:hypothetical protein
MGGFFDYREVPCPACGHLNRRFGSALLDGRYAAMCDRCGRDLATGRFSVGGAIQWLMLRLAVWSLCSMIGAGLAALLFAALGGLLRVPRHGPASNVVYTVVLLIGAAGGFVVAERNFRRGGFTGPKRVAADSPEAHRAPGEVRADGESVVVVRDSPGERASFVAKTARQWCLGLGYLSGLVVGVAANWANHAVGAPLPFEKDGLIGLGMVTGLIAGWAWGRWKFPPPPRGGSDA